MKLLVLGAGLQGCACAYDLLQNPAITQVTLADHRRVKLPKFLAGDWNGPPSSHSARCHRSRRGACGVCDHAAVMSAIPYYYNGPMAQGRRRVRLPLLRPRWKYRDRAGAEAAARRGRGEGRVGHSRLRPGARDGQHPCRRGHPAAGPGRAVKIFVGGLPQHPEPPLNYQIVYSLEGALDYYTTPPGCCAAASRCRWRP